MIPIYKPYLSKYKESAIDAINSEWVSNHGKYIDLSTIKLIRPDIILIEDNCEGFFGKYNNTYTGASQSVYCTSISFYGNKIITSGEGGCFVTNDDGAYEYIKRVYSHGMTEIRYVHNIH